MAHIGPLIVSFPIGNDDFPSFIVSFPIKMVIFHSYVSHYQRYILPLSQGPKGPKGPRRAEAEAVAKATYSPAVSAGR